MQAPSTLEAAAELDRLIRDALPDGRGLDAWRALLRAHACLMRELATDLAMKTRLPLGDFDVLAQLGLFDGLDVEASERATLLASHIPGWETELGELAAHARGAAAQP